MNLTIQLLFPVLAILVIMLVFLILRRLVWWYWGITQHLENQQTIIDLLKAQLELEQITQNQAARRRSETTSSALESHQAQNQVRPRSPILP